jgi:hypothetical protein
VRRRFHGIRRRCSFFLDLGKQSGLNRGGGPLLLRTIKSETAGRVDYGAQLGDAVATRVIEVHKRKAGHSLKNSTRQICRTSQAIVTVPETSLAATGAATGGTSCPRASKLLLKKWAVNR